MSGFSRGPIWPDLAGTPTDPTTTYTTSTRELEILAEPELALRIIVDGEDCDAIEIRVEVSTDAVPSWRVVTEKRILGTIVGEHQTSLSLPSFCHTKISARRIGGGVNTTVVVHAAARRTLGEVGADGQGIEHAAELACWHDGVGAALALPAAYGYGPAVGGIWIAVGEADTLAINLTLLGPTTSVDLRLEETLDEGTTISQLTTGDVEIDGADGTTRISWPVLPGGRYRLSAQRVGAAATMLGTARAYKLGASARQEIVSVTGTPVAIGAITVEVPTAFADGTHVSLITDLERYLRTVDKAHDVLVAAELVASVNPDSSNRDAAAQIICDVTNLAASAAFPDAAGIAVGDRPGLAFILSLNDVTSVRFDASNDGAVWGDVTSQLMVDGALGRAAGYFTSGAGVTTIFSGTWDCGHNHIRLYVTVPNATNVIYIDLIQRAR